MIGGRGKEHYYFRNWDVRKESLTFEFITFLMVRGFAWQRWGWGVGGAGRLRECEVEDTTSAKVLGWELAKAKTGLWMLGEMFLDGVR